VFDLDGRPSSEMVPSEPSSGSLAVLRTAISGLPELLRFALMCYRFGERICGVIFFYSKVVDFGLWYTY